MPKGIVSGADFIPSEGFRVEIAAKAFADGLIHRPFRFSQIDEFKLDSACPVWSPPR